MTSASLFCHARERPPHQLAVGAAGQGVDEAERWAAITGLLDKAIGARASMFQDVEAQRRTEIDVINGAIVAAGQSHAIATPLNDAMVWMVKSLQGKYLAERKA